MTMVLHNYFRSSTSTRLRAALNLKGLSTRYQPYQLKTGEQNSQRYLSLNPQGLVPALELEDGTVLTQSLAIMEYLEEVHPEPPLLPRDAIGRARVRALAFTIACEVHPLNNLRVLKHLRATFGTDDAGVTAWFRHWVEATFVPLETMLSEDPQTGRFCHGDTPGLADCCLYAQVLNNARFDVDMTPYPTIGRIFNALDALEPFAAAAPASQPDAEA